MSKMSALGILSLFPQPLLEAMIGRKVFVCSAPPDETKIWWMREEGNLIGMTTPEGAQSLHDRECSCGKPILMVWEPSDPPFPDIMH